jgi:hypothetical protein
MNQHITTARLKYLRSLPIMTEEEVEAMRYEEGIEPDTNDPSQFPACGDDMVD